MTRRTIGALHAGLPAVGRKWISMQIRELTDEQDDWLSKTNGGFQASSGMTQLIYDKGQGGL